MALSGTASKGHCSEVLQYIIEWSAVQNIVANTLTLTVDFYLDNSEQYGILPTFPVDKEGKSYITVAGKKQTFTNTGILGKGKHHLHTYVVTIPAATEANTTVSIEAHHHFDQEIYISYGKYYPVEGGITSTYTITVDAIYRRSRVSAYETPAVLGKPHYLRVEKGTHAQTHKIEYICGTKTGLVCERTSETTIENVVFPVDLATENTTGTEVRIYYRVSSYYGEDFLTSYDTSAVYKIPESVIPSCTIAVTDGEGLTDKYGGYVQSHSRFDIVVTPILAYNSPIVSYEITANGKTYDTTEISTAVIKLSGEQAITAKLTDERGRTGEVSVTVDVIPYFTPTVSAITKLTCDAEGNLDEKGEYTKVIFSAKIAPINDKNSATYIITYSESSGLGRVEETMSDFNGNYAVEKGEYIFATSPDKLYMVIITAKDDFGSYSQTKGGEAVTILMNWLASGKGLCFGGIATVDGAVENRFLTFPSGGFMFPKLETKVNDATTPNVYYCEDPQDAAAPTDDPFLLEVYPVGDDGSGIMQRLTTRPTGDSAPEVWVCPLHASTGSAWFNIVTGEKKVVS